MKIKFKKLDKRAVLPAYAHEGDSGMDIRCIEPVVIYPGETVKVGTGICAEIPHGYEIQVRPRSGMSKDGVFAVFGTVDEGYRGEIGVILHNSNSQFVSYGEFSRIAQLVLAPVVRAEIEETKDELSSTERGDGGFGSTGVK